jgi:hypothetical protein
MIMATNPTNSFATMGGLLSAPPLGQPERIIGQLTVTPIGKAK